MFLFASLTRTQTGFQEHKSKFLTREGSGQQLKESYRVKDESSVWKPTNKRPAHYNPEIPTKIESKRSLPYKYSAATSPN